MRLRPRLAISALLLLTVAPVFAQTPSIATEAVSETPTRLKTLTPSDVRRITASADSGDAVDQYWLGQIYEDGRLVPKDDNMARRWTQQSAAQNFGAAEYAMLRWEGHDPVTAEMWTRRAAEDGEAHAAFWLGVAFEQNRYGTTDLVEAAKWYRVSAEQGYEDAEYSLGCMYEWGEGGLSQDYKLAVEWYRRAAEHFPVRGGASPARARLGYLYADGLGVPKDYVQAYFWLSLFGPSRDLDEFKSHMTPAQVELAQQLADDWKKQHPDTYPPDR